MALEAGRRSSYPSHRASAVRGSSGAFETAPPSWDQRSMDRWSTQLQSPSFSIPCWSPALQELCLKFQCLHSLLVMEAELETVPSDWEESSIPLVAYSDYPQYVIVIVTLSQI